MSEQTIADEALDVRKEPEAFGFRNSGIRDALAEIVGELREACKKHRRFASAHEGYAIILEELDELKEQIWRRSEYRDKRAVHQEALHVAAMAVRFMLDVK